MDKKKPISINTIISVITLQRVQTSQNLVSRVHLRLISLICVSYDDETSTEARQVEGGSGEIRPGGLMAPWVYDEKFLTDV
jgi:hypothetical protein